MVGYQNKLLRINLEERKAITEPLNLEWTKKYIGGKGLGIKYLYEELKPGTDALAAENKLVLMTGPLTGTTVACSGKLAIISRSPATGTILDCSIGGHVAAEIRYAGYDGIILEGAMKEPSYLYIEDNRFEIHSAQKLWGQGAFYSERFLLQKHGRDCKVLCIGPGGENMLPMACINSDFYRQAGRGGIGAVMGSKKVKAIVIKGNGSVAIRNSKVLLPRLNQFMRESTLTDDNLWAYTDGTPTLVNMSQAAGILPTRNFQDGCFAQFEEINSEAMSKVRIGKKGCHSCALGCGNFTKVGGSLVEGPEYETLALCGSNCGIGDLEAVVKFNQMCDDMGLDTISTGSVTAFAMELTEKGIKDFGLHFGDKESYLKVPEQIARRQGIGAELCLGVKELAKKYGGTDFAMHVKGLELPGYEPRGAWGMGLAYATSERGACHTRAWPVADEAYGDLDAFTGQGKAELVVKLQNYNSVKYSAIICDFWAISLDALAEVLNLVTEESYTAESLDVTGERITNIARLFNLREGFNRDQDTLPKRIFNEMLKTGATAGKKLPKVEFEKMLAEFYAIRGWQKDGSIEKTKLAELDI